MNLRMWMFWLCLGVGGAAVAGTPVSVTVGEQKVVKVSVPVVRVTSSDASTLAVQKTSSKDVMVTGKQLGKATVVMKTANGLTLTVDIHVVSEGSHVYSAQR